MHLTEQTDQPRPTVFRKCWASCDTSVNVILQKYGKGGGRGGRTSLQQLEFYFDASLFVCFLLLLFFRLFCLRLFVCLFVFFFFSSQGNNYNMDGISYYSTFCFCLHLFVQRASIVRSFLRW